MPLFKLAAVQRGKKVHVEKGDKAPDVHKGHSGGKIKIQPHILNKTKV